MRNVGGDDSPDGEQKVIEVDEHGGTKAQVSFICWFSGGVFYVYEVRTTMMKGGHQKQVLTTV